MCSGSLCSSFSVPQNTYNVNEGLRTPIEHMHAEHVQNKEYASSKIKLPLKRKCAIKGRFPNDIDNVRMACAHSNDL